MTKWEKAWATRRLRRDPSYGRWPADMTPAEYREYKKGVNRANNALRKARGLPSYSAALRARRAALNSFSRLRPVSLG